MGTTRQRGGDAVLEARAVTYELTTAPEILVTGASGDPNVESFRRLRSQLTATDVDPAHVIVITSPLPAEGKSFVSLNLALAFSRRSEERTLLIDADLRRSGAPPWIEPAPQLGLSDVLAGRASLDDAVVTMSNSAMRFLAKGTVPEDEIQLDSSTTRELFAQLRQRYDRVIVDTPPIVPFADAAVLARFADGALMVVRNRVTPKSLYLEALEGLGQTRIFGVVLNDVGRNLADKNAHYDRYYSHYYKNKR